MSGGFSSGQIVSPISLEITSSLNAPIVRSILSGENEGATGYSNVGVTDNDLHVVIHNPTTAFGEVATAELTPSYQIDAIYGEVGDDIDFFTSGSGTATISGNLYVTETGATMLSYGTVRSKRATRYRPGQGTQHKFTALFSGAVSNGLMFAGPGNETNGLYFGYNGTTFGTFLRGYGEMPIRKFSFTVAPTASQTATFTLEGNTFPIVIRAGTIFNAAWEVEQSASSFLPNWIPFSNSGSVYFLWNSTAEAKTGTYDFSTSGGNSTTGSFTTLATGSSVSSSFYPQSSWSEDRFDGLGPSGILLDPSKGNVYGVQVQYLGFGGILFSIESPTTARLVPAHKISYANTFFVPSVRDPNFKMTWAAASAGSTSPMSVKGASAAGFNEGKVRRVRNPRGIGGTQSTLTSTFQNVASIRVPPIYNGLVHSREIKLDSITVTNEGNKQAEVRLILNPIFSSSQTWQFVDTTYPFTEYETTLLPSTNGTILTSFGVGAGTSTTLNLNSYDIFLVSRNIFTIAGRFPSGGSTPNITWGLTWYED